MKRWIVGLAGLVVLVGAGQVEGALEVLFGSELYTEARDGGRVDVKDLYDGPISSLVDIDRTVSDRASSANSILNFTSTDGGERGVFDLQVSHSRASTPEALGHSRGRTKFTVSQPSEYSISGYYQLTGRHWVRASARLYNVSDGILEFQTIQQSSSTPNELFILGEEGGDGANTLVGAASGSLDAGKEYEFVFELYLANFITATYDTAPASAAGDITLAITSASTMIPEPSSLIVWGTLGGLGLIVARRRRKRVV